LFEEVHANEITRHWLAKNPTEFLKVWHKKFGKRIDAKAVLPGCHSDQQFLWQNYVIVLDLQSSSPFTLKLYTVSEKKEATLFSTTTLAFLGRFL